MQAAQRHWGWTLDCGSGPQRTNPALTDPAWWFKTEITAIQEPEAGGSPMQGYPNLMLKPLGPDQYTHQRFGVAVVCCYFILANSPVNGKSVERKTNQRREWAPRDVREA